MLLRNYNIFGFPGLIYLNECDKRIYVYDDLCDRQLQGRATDAQRNSTTNEINTLNNIYRAFMFHFVQYISKYQHEEIKSHYGKSSQ